MVDWCQKNDIVVSAFAPFGNPGRFWSKPGETNLLNEEVVTGIAQKHGKTPAQVKGKPWYWYRENLGACGGKTLSSV